MVIRSSFKKEKNKYGRYYPAIILIIVLLGILYFNDKSEPSLSNEVQCVPSVEKCDNIDNDCNFRVDDNLGNYSCGVGACKRSDRNCVGGVIQKCVPGLPSAERCKDNIDNDCDGAIDERGCV